METLNLLSLTRSRVVLSKTSTSFSSLVLDVKMKSSSTHSTYFVVTWETARFRPANQPYDTENRPWDPKKHKQQQLGTELIFSVWSSESLHMCIYIVIYNITLKRYNIHYNVHPYLSKRHNVMFDVGSRNSFGIFTVISNYYGYSRIVSSHTVDKILKLIIT